ncbi:MAG: hypothetical protein AAF515_13210 [Pseudomonadota bacterium]
MLLRALIRREWLEHRFAFQWAPLIVAAVLVGLALLATSLDLGRIAAEASEATQSQERLHLPSALAFAALPFVFLYLASAASVLVSALYTERQDRSISFFKSLPVSDSQTVLAKLVTALLLAPLMSIAALTITQLLLVALLVVNCDCGSGLPATLAEAELLSGLPLQLFGFLTQATWSLPIWSWLLLVSAIAPRQPMLFAFAGPALLACAEWLVFGSARLTGALGAYLEPVGLVAYLQLAVVGANDTVSWQLAAAPWLRHELWLGLLLSAALLTATVFARRRNGEL